jgi:hypothetical protein
MSVPAVAQQANRDLQRVGLRHHPPSTTPPSSSPVSTIGERSASCSATAVRGWSSSRPHCAPGRSGPSDLRLPRAGPIVKAAIDRGANLLGRRAGAQRRTREGRYSEPRFGGSRVRSSPAHGGFRPSRRTDTFAPRRRLRSGRRPSLGSRASRRSFLKLHAPGFVRTGGRFSQGAAGREQARTVAAGQPAENGPV